MSKEKKGRRKEGERGKEGRKRGMMEGRSGLNLASRGSFP